jgi:hypothetical protein
MSEQQNIAIAKKLLAGMAGGQDPDAIAALFDNNLVFEIQGDDGVLPWIGINATDNITATQFAIILTIESNVVTRFQMLEDSFDVSKAARA